MTDYSQIDRARSMPLLPMVVRAVKLQRRGRLHVGCCRSEERRVGKEC